MNVTIDPILGESRMLDYKIPQAKTTATVSSNTAEIEVLRGGERYEFHVPLKELTITEVVNSPFESEVIFSGINGLAIATKIFVGIKTGWDEVEHTLNQDDPAATGNARTFSAQFQDDDTDWNGYGTWVFRAYVDSTTRKWTIYSEFSGEHWAEVPETGEWDYVPITSGGVFAVAKEADTELELVEWTEFDYDRIPRGNAISEGIFAETDGGVIPPALSLPVSVGIIGSLPEFEAGKRYILNFRDGLVVGAEVHQ